MPVRARIYLLLVPLAACAPGNSLSGSVTADDSLSFTTASLTVGSNQFVVQYREGKDVGYDVPFQLTVEVGAPPVAKGTVIQLGSQDSSGQPVAIATRSVTGDTRTFPAIKSGTLTFNQAVAVGQPTSGSFFLVFDYQNDATLGQGHTIQGSFQGVVESSS